MRTARVAALSVLVLVVVAALISGCGSEWWIDDDYYDDDYDEPSVWKSVHIYLNVADQDGKALPGVTVWVDGEAQSQKTANNYDRLDGGFPPEWRGWRYNWSGGPFWFRARSGRHVVVEIVVSKSGYESQRTTFRLDYWDPDEIYVRQTFVMEPSAGTTSVPAEAPQAPEIISSAQVSH
ncbi:MAG: hypothetical protein J7M38_14605 [Armatimonadetes bacterium]|nr:hypothetical protein [Armatimonadota bacterium]